MIKVKLKSIIAESFWELHKDIKKGIHTHYWLKGGRGSTKDSFISIEIVLGIMRDAQEVKLTITYKPTGQVIRFKGA